MISQLAKSTYEKWLSEGLAPSFQDIVDLNTVGIELERNESSSAFYCAPRISFLGDLLLHEPTIGKSLYLDGVRQIIANDNYGLLYAFVYVLNTPFEELPKLDSAKSIAGAVKAFAEKNLMNFTERQMMAAIDYALHGFNESQLSRNYDDVNDEVRDAIELPRNCVSMAQMMLNKALGYNIDYEGSLKMTVPQLDRVLAIASMNNGIDVLKDENMQRTGKFYQVAGKIHARLLKEKDEKDNG